jgi:uncharacterized protein YbjT (DUF2867 family)
MSEAGTVLVLGASGYIGSHLVPALSGAGYRVRAASRHREVLEGRGWDGVELVEADALDRGSLDRAMEGVDAAYYLVHSMAAGRDFPRIDREAAAHFRDAAAAAGVGRIVYLSGLQPDDAPSRHLASRLETGEVLRQGPVPVTELRAGMIVGPGSAAFEVIRDLVYHLPVMVTPRWVESRSQPIALSDLVAYLVRCLQVSETAGRTFDVGGGDILTYREMMRQFGELVDRRPVVVGVPVLTPRLSSYWLDLVTAVPANVARPLVEGLAHDVIARDEDIRTLIPMPLMRFKESAAAALQAERRQSIPARWTEGALAYRRARPDFAFYAKKIVVTRDAPLPPEALWREVSSIGGERGWYYQDWLWEMRGAVDRLLGGVGMRRGRRDPEHLRVGDALDFWRVTGWEPERRLTLVAEMRLPGSAAMEFHLEPLPEGGARLKVLALFHPAGAKGLVYWYALLPGHKALFGGLADAIVSRATRRARETAAA